MQAKLRYNRHQLLPLCWYYYRQHRPGRYHRYWQCHCFLMVQQQRFPCSLCMALLAAHCRHPQLLLPPGMRLGWYLVSKLKEFLGCC